MKRIRIVALALVAAFAMSAIAASAASAEPVFVSKAKLGEAVATHIPTTATLGSAFLESASGTKISCSGGTSTGELTGPKSSAKNITKFTGCESGGQPCENAAAKEIVTKPLAAELQGISSSLPGLRLGNETASGTPERHGTVAEFTCAGALKVIVKGTIIGSLSGAAGSTAKAAETGKLLASTKLSFAEEKGKQKYCAFAEGSAEDKECEQLESSVGGAAFEKAGESVIATIKTVPSTWEAGVTK